MLLENILAPAKINRFLHVVGRRADGYHELQTVFQLLDWADILHFETRSDGRVVRATAFENVPEAQDLTVRAARLLQQATGCTQGTTIHLQKKLPLGSGLGGGSSDAASSLWALNQLWGTHLTRAQLMRLGLQLGADVPFFLLGQNAFAQGVGEVLTPLSLPNTTFLLVIPPVSVPTPRVFQDPELTRSTPTVKIADFSASEGHYVTGFGRNDLEPVASALFAPVARALQVLRDVLSQSGAHNARYEVRMSGSGSSVYAVVDNATQAEALGIACQQQLGVEYRCLVVTSLAKHPLTGWREVEFKAEI